MKYLVFIYNKLLKWLFAKNNKNQKFLISSSYKKINEQKDKIYYIFVLKTSLKQQLAFCNLIALDEPYTKENVYWFYKPITKNQFTDLKDESGSFAFVSSENEIIKSFYNLLALE
jgi:hypothetical protein